MISSPMLSPQYERLMRALRAAKLPPAPTYSLVASDANEVWLGDELFRRIHPDVEVTP